MQNLLDIHVAFCGYLARSFLRKDIEFYGKTSLRGLQYICRRFFYSCIDFLLFFVRLLVSRPETGPTGYFEGMP